VGVASQPFKHGTKAFGEPLFSTRPSIPVFHLMRFYTGVCANGPVPRHRNRWGRANDCRRSLIPGFTFSTKSMMPVVKALAGWRGWS